ncbi:MAG: rRNA methyltransferase [Actinobacteria bacterium]|nr:MAG: rRNA methyltransferase [Actinomycetota bacterium]
MTRVGPHPQPWPAGAQFDPELLEHGDPRNVVDRYRYWSVDSIVDDLDGRRHGFHVAIENWEHDFNIGTVVRNANAFLAARVHVIGERRWDRRGAMSTHRYQHVEHHADIESFAVWAQAKDLPIIAIENVDGSIAIETARLPKECILLFGQEGPGLSKQALAASSMICEITQYGSTRSLNAGVASGIAMYAWALQHAGHD